MNNTKIKMNTKFWSKYRKVRQNNLHVVKKNNDEFTISVI